MRLSDVDRVLDLRKRRQKLLGDLACLDSVELDGGQVTLLTIAFAVKVPLNVVKGTMRSVLKASIDDTEAALRELNVTIDE